MIFKIEKLNAVIEEISKLEQNQQDLLKIEFETIENKGIEFVKVKHLQNKIFEIKTKEIRSYLNINQVRLFLLELYLLKKHRRLQRK